MNRDTLKKLLNTRTTNPTKKEAGLYEQLKRASLQYNKPIRLSRIENWMTLGLPDLLICDHNHKFHFVELKYVKFNAVNLSPQQISWITLHKGASVWILVKSTKGLHLYRADQAIELKEQGIKLEPHYFCPEPFDWQKTFDLIL